MNCEIYKDLVAAHVDDALSSGERQDVEEHLGACQECQLLFGQEQEFLRRIATFSSLSHATRPLSEAAQHETSGQMSNWLVSSPVDN